MRDCPNVRRQGKGSDQPQASGLTPMFQGRITSLLSVLGVTKKSADVVTGMLQVFTINVYDLLDPGATLSFVTPLLDMKFDIFPHICMNHFHLLPRWVI